MVLTSQPVSFYNKHNLCQRFTRLTFRVGLCSRVIFSKCYFLPKLLSEFIHTISFSAWTQSTTQSQTA